MPSADYRLLSERIWDRIEALAHCSEGEGALTRVFLSKEQRAATDLVAGWMASAGMAVHIDAIGNVIGRYEGTRPGLPCAMVGSHLDTVRNAGKYDGILGVVAGIACIEALQAKAIRLPFAIEVIGFADEEGTRFQSTLLGSRAVAGTFEARRLQAKDETEITVAEAMRAYGLDPSRISEAARRRDPVLGYVEFHIEQGPVLEAENLPVGVVTAINGATRLSVRITGMAGHAGTVPMRLRKDALAGAAEAVLAVERICSERPEVVGTVGKLASLPGAVNVIPGEAVFTIDIRAPIDADRTAAVEAVRDTMESICTRRGLRIAVETTFEAGSTACAPWLMDRLDAAVAGEKLTVRRLPSGAGHDGMAMAALTDVAMLFLRCAGGINHSPAESVTLNDIETGLRVLLRFIEQFRPRGQAS